MCSPPPPKQAPFFATDGGLRSRRSSFRRGHPAFIKRAEHGKSTNASIKELACPFRKARTGTWTVQRSERLIGVGGSQDETFLRAAVAHGADDFVFASDSAWTVGHRVVSVLQLRHARSVSGLRQIS